MRALITLIFVLSHFMGFATRYSGTVTLACSNMPLQGVVVQITGTNGIGGFSYTTQTDTNGEYFFNVSGTSSYWRIIVKSPKGRTNPISYTFYPSQGNRENVNFQMHIQPDLYYGSQYSGGILLDPSQHPTSVTFNPVEHCSQSGICINIDEGFASDYYWGTGDNSVCFSANVYQVTKEGRRIKNLGNTDCVRIEGRPSVGEGGGCDRYPFHFDHLIQSAVGGLIEIEITQGCCDKRGGCIAGGFTNSWKYYFEILGLSNASVAFNFNVSLAVDANNPGDPGNDGVQPVSTTPRGPTLGRISSAINATINSTETLDEMTYNLYEVDCLNGADENLLISNAVPLNNSGQPDNYSFANFRDAGNSPYFLNPANHLGKCFKVECVATNRCGEVSAYSYFTIDPNEFLWEGGSALIAVSGSDSPHHHIAVYPNPVKDMLTIDMGPVSTVERIELINANGQLVRAYFLDAGVQQIDVASFAPGIYTLRSSVNGQKNVRFVKH